MKIANPNTKDNNDGRVRPDNDAPRNCEMLYDQVQETRAKLLGQGRWRDDLTRMIVHDMRSPLMCITGGLELIRHEWESKGVLSLDLWQMIAVSAQEVVGLCDNLLDISRLEAGQRPIRQESCELASSIDKAVAAVQNQADLQGVAIRVEGEATFVFADNNLLRRILVNLLTKAIKGTLRGGVLVVRATSLGNDVRVEVQNIVRGIPGEVHGNSFEEFGQDGIFKVDRKDVAGFDLLFCKLAVEAQGGRIGVYSEPGKGNMIWFTLPAFGARP